jgi:hypothetical protein
MRYSKSSNVLRDSLRLWTVAILSSLLMFACGGIEGDTLPEDDSVGQSEHAVVQKHVMLAGPGAHVWGGDDWNCQPGYEDSDCPSATHPGCTVGDVDSGNCVCPWEGYCRPFFD